MEVFFDLEFTGLHQRTTPISIGLVTMNGDMFYAEFTDFDRSQCNNTFIQKEVIGNLIYGSDDTKIQNKTAELTNMMEVSMKSICEKYDASHNTFIRGNHKEIQTNLIRWLSRYDTVEWISDVCHYDFVLLIDILFGNALSMPKNMGTTCYDVNYDIAAYYNIPLDDAFNISREEFVKIHIDPRINATYYRNSTDEKENLLKLYIPKRLNKHNSLYDAFVIRGIYNYIHPCLKKD